MNRKEFKNGDYVLNNKNNIVYLDREISNSIGISIFVQIDNSGISNLLYNYNIVRKATDSEIDKYLYQKNSHKYNI